MAPLRHLSARPQVVVDERGRSTGIGMPGPLGRERVVYALPFGTHGNDRVPGFQIDPPNVVVAVRSDYPADPNDVMIGSPGLWIARMLTARWTEDTRRLGG
jgi:hypothetical protein